jgi:sulfate permease, SulP family
MKLQSSDDLKARSESRKPLWLSRYLPILDWGLHYRREDLAGDMIAGVIAAIMLIPQSMAYALLAGLPVQVGLYASILPLMLYAVLGTSRVLSVGPVAIVALLTAQALAPLAASNTSTYLALALVLALLVGIVQLGMGLIRLGFFVNFLSHSVIAGFSSAAAVIIAIGQLKSLLGLKFATPESFIELVKQTIGHLPQANLFSSMIGLVSLVSLLLINQRLAPLLKQWRVKSSWIMPIVRSGPLFVVLISTMAVWIGQLNQTANVTIVGIVPTGLPQLTLPHFSPTTWQSLLPAAVVISLVSFVESIAVAKSLASQRRQKIDANQELIALGAANLGAALTGGFPVTGGFSRSVVNFAAGANTGLASIITALLIAIAVLFLTPLFYFLPQSTLAATIIIAVMGLLEVKTLRQMWRYNIADALCFIVTFMAVLGLGIETGIMIGVATSVALFLWRTSFPHIAVVGRVGETEHFRNVHRHQVQTYPGILALRVDGSLYFANTKYLEDYILTAIADRPEIRHLVLICSAINFIDASALETLEGLIVDLQGAGVQIYLAEVKGPVFDRLQHIGFTEKLGADRVFLSTHQAMQHLTEGGSTPK